MTEPDTTHALDHTRELASGYEAICAATGCGYTAHGTSRAMAEQIMATHVKDANPKKAAYSEISNFASCPAATGQPTASKVACPHFPDGAHRCAGPREHASAPGTQERPNYAHACTCTHTWVSMTWTGRRNQP